MWTPSSSEQPCELPPLLIPHPLGACWLHFDTYQSGDRIAIELYDASDGAPMATASVNLPDLPYPEKHTYIKNWSENAGIDELLVSAGILWPAISAASNGMVTAPLHPVLVDPKAWNEATKVAQKSAWESDSALDDGQEDASAPTDDLKKLIIAQLNDTLRSSFLGGQVVMTSGVQALEADVRERVLTAVREFSEFQAGNDPYQEHDFHPVQVEGGPKVYFKIDYYRKGTDYTEGSETPWNSKTTDGVMTITLADEY